MTPRRVTSEMVITPVGVRSGRGARPFNPFRDLPAVTSLLVRTFGAEMKLEPSASPGALRLAARFPGLAWLWLGFDAWFDGSLAGFVWEEDGRVVGNANIAPLTATSREWVLSNVAVEPEYRGRGIATGLVEAAIAYARERGCRRVLLQVWAGNEAATRLYFRQGFHVFGSTHRLRFEPGSEGDMSGDAACPDGLQWRAPRPGDIFHLEALAAAAIPYEVQRLRPSGVTAFRVGMGDWTRLSARWPGLRRGASRRVLVENGAVRAGVAARPVDGGRARLIAIVSVEAGEGVAGCVAAGAEAAVRQGGFRSAICDVPEKLLRLGERLEARGFLPVDTLLHMALDLTATH